MADTIESPDVTNFGAGPGKLPKEVLERVKNELLSYGDAKVSILEMSHGSHNFQEILEDAKNSVRDLLEIPENYKILFMHGGGTGIFAAVPMNLLNSTGRADYIVTGLWSAKAAREAKKYGKVNMVVPEVENYTGIPDPSTWNLDPNASYVYYCPNETIHGIEFDYVPEVGNVPLVADMSSNILTRSLDVSKFGVIFAAAQKNLGTAGVVLVIVREDLLRRPMSICPTIFDFSAVASGNSMQTTPPTFQIYVCGLVFDWVKKNGGLQLMEKLIAEKCKMIYDVVDESEGFYSSPVKRSARSRMNATFRIEQGNERLEKSFLEGAAERGMIQLNGHRIVGGIRVSLYNAVTIEEVRVLASYMKSFHNLSKKRTIDSLR